MREGWIGVAGLALPWCPGLGAAIAMAPVAFAVEEGSCLVWVGRRLVSQDAFCCLSVLEVR